MLVYFRAFLTINDVCNVMERARSVEDEALICVCLDFMTKHAYAVMGTVGFLHISEYTLYLVLRSRRLTVLSENSVLHACVKWAQNKSLAMGLPVYKTAKKIKRYIRFRSTSLNNVMIVKDIAPGFLNKSEINSICRLLNNERNSMLPKRFSRQLREKTIETIEIYKPPNFKLHPGSDHEGWHLKFCIENSTAIIYGIRFRGNRICTGLYEERVVLFLTSATTDDVRAHCDRQFPCRANSDCDLFFDKPCMVERGQAYKIFIYYPNNYTYTMGNGSDLLPTTSSTICKVVATFPNHGFLHVTALYMQAI
jgi:hypothetical protein